ncbi:MAG: phosphatase PAP2 family protein [Anaerovoracaceae bacterium]
MQNNILSKRNVLLIILALLVAGIFSIVFYYVSSGNSQALDLRIAEWAYSIRLPGLNTFFEAITYLANTETIIAICLLLLIYPNTRFTYGIPVSAIAIVNTISNKTIKHIVERARPDKAMQIISEGGYSFPSGHASTSTAVYGLLLVLIIFTYLEQKKSLLTDTSIPLSLNNDVDLQSDKNVILWPNFYNKKRTLFKVLCLLFAALPFLISFSRVYLGVHYFTDVLAGMLEGLFFVIVTVIVIPLFYRKKS